MKKKKIEEIIVVEGRDDTAAVKRAVDAETIETHGFGLNEAIWEQLRGAYESKGLIIFTDPDHAGKTIRRKLIQAFPKSKEAFLPRNKAVKRDNIGVENAASEDIVDALFNAKATVSVDTELAKVFDMDMLLQAGLMGTNKAKAKREYIGDVLKIGYCNAKGMLRRLNAYRISEEEFQEAIDLYETLHEKEH